MHHSVALWAGLLPRTKWLKVIWIQGAKQNLYEMNAGNCTIHEYWWGRPRRAVEGGEKMHRVVLLKLRLGVDAFCLFLWCVCPVQCTCNNNIETDYCTVCVRFVNSVKWTRDTVHSGLLSLSYSWCVWQTNKCFCANWMLPSDRCLK